MRVMRGGALLLELYAMSGMPAATMRAMNSSGSMVRDVAFTVSMKDAAEYCGATCNRLVSQQRPGRAKTCWGLSAYPMSGDMIKSRQFCPMVDCTVLS